jgi:hypothetical protein
VPSLLVTESGDRIESRRAPGRVKPEDTDGDREHDRVERRLGRSRQPPSDQTFDEDRAPDAEEHAEHAREGTLRYTAMASRSAWILPVAREIRLGIWRIEILHHAA